MCLVGKSDATARSGRLRLRRISTSDLVKWYAINEANKTTALGASHVRDRFGCPKRAGSNHKSVTRWTMPSVYNRTDGRNLLSTQGAT